MKKLLSAAAILLTVLVLVLVVPTEAATGDVLYVSDAGSAGNTGLSPEKALNSLTDAIDKLPEEGGTVVVCGDITINSTAPVFTAKTGKVTVTGSYAGEDYAPTVILATSSNMYMQFLSEIEFNNLTFDRTSSSWCEFTTGPKLIFGEGLAFTKNGAELTYNSVTMMVRLGYSSAASSPDTKCESAYFEMHSGKLNYVHGGNKWNDVGSATIKMYGPATVTDHVQCGGTNFSVDSVDLTLDGVTIPALYIGGYAGSASKTSNTGNVTINAIDSTIGGMYNAREVYGSSSGAAYGDLTGAVSITLDNTGVDTIDMTGGTIADTANISLILENQDFFAVTDDLSWVNSLTVSGDSFVYVDADYAGPAAVTVAEGSTLLMNSALNTAADIPAGATLAHKYVMTLGENGSYTLTCTDETCGADTVTKTSGELNVVFLDGTAEVCGDGSLASNPVNSLDAAYARLKDAGGTIVVMNGFTVSATTAHQVVEWPTKTGKVTITGKYAGVSYDPTVAFYSTQHFTVQFRSPVEFSHMTFDRTYGSSIRYTQFATGPELTFGEGMVMLRAGNAMDSTNTFVVRCGYAASAPTDKTAKFTMLSGTLNFVQGGNSWMGAGSATIYVGEDAVITDHIQAGGVSGKSVTGDVKITIDGASVPNVYLGSHGASTITGNVDVIMKNLTDTAVAAQRSGSGDAYGIDGNLTVTAENCAFSAFSIAEAKRITGNVSVGLKDTDVSATVALGADALTIGGSFDLTAEGGTIKAIAGHYGIAGNAVYSLKGTAVTGNMRLGGGVTGTVTAVLDNITCGSDLQYVQGEGAASYSLTLKNLASFTSNSGFATIDSLTLENSSIIMGDKYEGPAFVAVGDGSTLYISGSYNEESEVPANSLTGTGKIVYLAPGSYEKGEPITMYYDDRLDVSGYDLVQILDKGTPTSYQVGYGVEANSVQDTAVITYNSATGKLTATGIGTATVVLGMEEVEITVEPAPISLFLMIGQSNMAGNNGNPDLSVVCPEGQVYSTMAPPGDKWATLYGYDGMQALTTGTGPSFVASALAGDYSTTNQAGGTKNLSLYPIDSLTADGGGKTGLDSAFAYEWNKLTGEKVWVINAAHGGTSMGDWLYLDDDANTGKEYRQAATVFNAALTTMQAEVRAGHYTLENYAYLWCQGCADRVQTTDWYLDKFSLLHERLKTDFACDFGDGKGERTLESANIVLVRACGEDGMNSQEDAKRKDYWTYHDLEMNGVRSAQYYMGNSTESAFTDVHVVSNVGDQWVYWDEAKTEQTVDTFFAERYPNGIDYTVQSGAVSLPTKPEDVRGGDGDGDGESDSGIHYNQLGHNENGREAARNMVYRIYPELAPDEEVSIKLYAWDGVTDLAGRTDTEPLTEYQTIVPVVYPLYRSKELVLTGDMLHDYSALKGTDTDYAYYAIDGCQNGTVTATLSDVSVTYNLKPGGETKTFRWEIVDGVFTTVTGDGLTANALTKLTGTNTGSVLTGASFRLAESVVLYHDQPWMIEWKGALHGNAGDGKPYFLLASSCSTNTLDAPNIIVSDHSVILNRRLDDGTTYTTYESAPYAKNYFRHLRAKTSIALDETHTYRLVNEIAADGSNMVYLYIDGVKKAAMNLLVSDSTNLGTSDWMSGKDFVFSHIGTKSAGLSNVTDSAYASYDYTLTGTLNYMQIDENRLIKTEAKSATCVTDGNKEYYTDPVTGKLYLDSNGTQETTLAAVTIAASHTMKHIPAEAATCVKYGNTEYWYCSECDGYFSDAEGESELEKGAWEIKPHGLAGYKETEATCDEDGNLAYWYCAVCDKYYKDDAATEEFGENGWVVPGGHQLVHTPAAAAECTQPGNLEYWSCEICGKVFKDAAAAEEYGENGWVIPAAHDMNTEYTSDDVGHWYSCRNCDYKEGYDTHGFDTTDCTETATCATCGYEKAAGSHIWSDWNTVEEASCTLPGAKTRKCTSCGEEDEAEISPKGHDMVYYAYSAPSCDTDGNEPYWYCEECKLYFSDEDGLSQIGEFSWILERCHTIVYVPAVTPDCVNDGSIAHYKCTVCGALFGDQAGTILYTPDEVIDYHYGHEYDGIWTWSEDGQSVELYLDCTNCDHGFDVDPEAIVVEILDSEEASCAEDGFITYKATFDGIVTVSDTKTVPISAHGLTCFAPVQPGKTTAGNIEYWRCDVCGKYFTDANGENEVAQEDIVLAPTSRWGDADGDGDVDEDDAAAIKRHRAGLISADDLDLDVCDLDGNAVVDVYDAYLIQLFAESIIVRFPVEAQG